MLPVLVAFGFLPRKPSPADLWAAGTGGSYALCLVPTCLKQGLGNTINQDSGPVEALMGCSARAGQVLWTGAVGRLGLPDVGHVTARMAGGKEAVDGAVTTQELSS